MYKDFREDILLFERTLLRASWVLGCLRCRVIDTKAPDLMGTQVRIQWKSGAWGGQAGKGGKAGKSCRIISEEKFPTKSHLETNIPTMLGLLLLFFFQKQRMFWLYPREKTSSDVLEHTDNRCYYVTEEYRSRQHV